jgi:DNA mismatch endonuclease (patch repair protein)
MADVHDPATRSRNMAAIRSRDTKPERLLRSALHKRGVRYRLHSKKVPGRPDILMPGRRIAIFVHGCFFHGHQCETFRWPKTRKDFWESKITGNVERDRRNENQLHAEGWRVAIVWSCALAGRGKIGIDPVADRLVDWMKSEDRRLEIAGVWPTPSSTA